ncbi:hypothetical protein C2E23DRAFT_808842 [Lenzites betulinus]|nr:hypothetical protein C2E23DRAFT_808842 [Lenzites betulinus]
MQSTPASRALLCQEILVEVLGHLSPGRPDDHALPKIRLQRREAQKALAHVARVCRAFMSPALDVLWRVTDSLHHLLAILPSFAPIKPHNYVLTRYITDAEWVRFQDYAYRVRELYMQTEVKISASVWIFLSRRCAAGHSLIPRLRRLDSLDVFATDPGKILLLTPTLRHLALNIDTCNLAEGPAVVDTIMELVQKISVPHLESLRVTAVSGVQPLNPSITPCASLVHLQELEIMSEIGYSMKTLEELLAFPHLRKLSVRPLFDREPEAPQALPPGFLSLRELKVIGVPRTVTQFLQLTSPPALESLIIQCTDWPPLTALPEDIMGLGSSNCTNLRRLEITISGYRIPHNLVALLSPAVQLKGLTHVAVRTDGCLDNALPIADTDLRAVAQAWPNLVEFEIGIKDPDALRRPPVPQTLILFAEHHPHLVKLVWPYIELSSPGLPDWCAVPTLAHGLQVFRSCLVKNSPLPKYRELAVFIDRLFPHLDLSDVQYSPATGLSHRSYYSFSYNNWCDVEQILLAIQAGRQGCVQKSDTHRTYSG